MTTRTSTAKTAPARDVETGIDAIIARARRERAETLRAMIGSLFGR